MSTDTTIVSTPGTAARHDDRDNRADRLDADVLIAGAGPTGLLLANELRLAGISTLVVERLTERSGQSKALSLQPRSAEMLQLRGWLEPLLSRAVDTVPGGHFAGLPLDYGVFDSPSPTRWASRRPGSRASWRSCSASTGCRCGAGASCSTSSRTRPA